MKLSVVIPTHGKEPLLRQTLAALADQDAGPERDWEIVVVDDGSRDGTAAFLAAEAVRAGSRLRVVSPGVNVGRAKARNLGARAAAGRWILFLDDDIVAPPGLLAAHLDLLEAHPGHGTIGAVETAPEVVDAPLFDYLDSRGVGRLPAGPAPARFFVTQNAAVPRAAFLAVGGFDEDFAAYGFEDMEVAFRLEEQAGVRFLVLAGPRPRHVHHHTLAQYLAKKVECGRHSLPHVARLHPGRVREMSLHWALDAPDGAPPGPAVALVRAVADGPLGRALPRLLGAWPCDRAHRPRLRALHHRLMNLAVLAAFRQGLTGRALS
ncbi:MAG TPA: glycosyltransferase [Candidatus Krumholzibacteria bacterium]|nr:glycosyltransferase [Candidatus Krumholzibacteria bacterium]